MPGINDRMTMKHSQLCSGLELENLMSQHVLIF